MQMEAEQGEVIDPLSGHPIRIESEHDEPDIDPDMPFWFRLDGELVGARSETGHHIPTEVDHVLTRWGIKDEENRECARYLLCQMCAGRIEAHNEEMSEIGTKADKDKPATP